MKITTTSYICDVCKAELPDNYTSTDGQGRKYFVSNLYNEIRLKEPVLECDAMVVHVRIGGRKDTESYDDLCNDCRLKLLKEAVEHLESGV